MIRHVLADTDVLIEFLRGNPQAVTFMEIFSDRIVLSSIVVAELCAGVKEGAEQEALAGFLSLFPVVPVTADIARRAGLYQRRFGPSHGAGLADAILAATAEAEGAELKTLSTRYYPMIEDLRPAYLKP